MCFQVLLISYFSLYSVLSATTGSFFAALRDGINPDITVKPILIKTSINAATGFRIALKSPIPVRACKMILIGMHKRYVTITPKRPEAKPIIKVSALNILETSLFDAPIARSIPISFVLSCTDISVITPTIIHETISDMATKAINT